MKKLFIASIVLLFFMTSCNSSEYKTKQVVKEWMKLNLDDYSSYDPIRFSEFDSSLSTFDEDYSILLSDSINIEKVFNSNLNLAEEYGKLNEFDEAKKAMIFAQELADSSKKINLFLKESRLKWKPSFNGYSIIHEYRAKDKLGNFHKHTVYFHIYRDFTGCEPIYDLK